MVSFVSFSPTALQDVMELRNQISKSGVQVDVDAPKGQDLAQIMDDMRASYEKIAEKNAGDLKRWHENQVGQTSVNKYSYTLTQEVLLFVGLRCFPSPCQIADVQVQVSQNTEALQGAQMEMGDLSRQIQTLEIELASQQSLVSMHFASFNHKHVTTSVP